MLKNVLEKGAFWHFLKFKIITRKLATNAAF